MWHYFDDADLAAVKEVLDRGVLGSIGDAPATRGLEAAFCEEFGSAHALGVCNAMAGLHSAVAASGAGAGDEVVVDSLVGFGALAVLFNNAIPVFADVRRDTHTMDVESLRSRISERTKAIIVTQLWGLIADMDEIMAIAKEHDLLVIEDCAHAIYATYNGKYAGTIGDVGVFSFQESKQLSTGDGGIVLFQDPDVGERINDMVTFGTMPSRVALNYRITEVMSAIAKVQLGKTPGYVDICVRSANQFNDAVAGSPLIAPQITPEGRVNTYHLWAATYEGDDQGLPYDDFQRIAAEQGVNFMWRYIQQAPYLFDVIREPVAFGRGCPTQCPLRARDISYDEGTCPTAELIMDRIMLAYTGGDPDANAVTADGLRKALEIAQG
ncbi:MAG TPA: DegT/DnrJ/EryC1/StrS family aminotransferase [Armatimonadota bacterium]|nr:DegT/DnrJ/EryC1/StrS family aminotransferase [Armatimonadota bacterium]